MHCYVAWYSNCPGLKVMAPYNAEDAKGLIKSACKDPDDCLLLENELLYCAEHETDEKVLDPDFLVPIGKAKIEKRGLLCL